MRYFVALLLVLVCASTGFAVEHIITGNFVETRSSAAFAHGYLNGKFYYYYNNVNGNATTSRLRLEYSVPSGSTLKKISNLYNYNIPAMYSMCSVCKAESIVELPDPWWFDSSVYKAESNGWYSHLPVGDAKTFQVSRIKMTSATSPSSSSLSIIEFADGRNMTVSGVKVDGDTGLSKNSAVFSPDSGLKCPTPTCSMLTDFVFVLDYSGSVSRDEWTNASKFAIGVMNSFTFGETAAAAACIQFNAPSCGSSGSKTKKVLCWDDGRTTKKSRYYVDWNYSQCSASSLTPMRTASVLAGEQLASGDWTVSWNLESLVTTMSTTRTPSGNTCQGLGLELAMKVFDKSPRNRYPGLNRVVIGVTDGADHCPNRTQRAAKKLRDEYGALFIGVGVGLECDYDRHFIENLTSDLAGYPAYFDVSDYAAIRTVVDDLFSPVCEQFHETECGPDCKGFCGCGDCFCPSCENPDGNTCHNYQCIARDGTASGCVDTVNKSACPASDKCTKYTCNYNSGSHVQTCPYTWSCTEVQKKNPGTCRTTKCKTDGTCQVVRDDSVCKKAFTNDMCEVWTCAEEGKSANDYPAGEYDATTGCYRSKNMHKTCEEKGKGKCVDYTCSLKTGQCEPTDLCKSDECTTRECPKTSSGEYGSDCKETAVPSPDTQCSFYNCDPVKGWELKHKKDEDECAAELFPNAADRECKEFDCDDSAGCYYTAFDPSECKLCNDETFKSQCAAQAQQSSTLKQCRAPVCELDGTATQAICNVNVPANITDCTTSSEAATAREMNKNNPSTCFTIECVAGKCKLTPVPRKQNEVDDHCTKYICDEYSTGQWKWKSVPTTVANNCVTDDCTHRVCVPDTGCVETDICSNRTTECVSYSCKEENGAPVCKGESMLQSYECMYERCNNGKKEKVYNSSDVIRNYCPEYKEDLCTDVSCSEGGECVYRPKIDIEKEKDGDDPCKLWDCDEKGVVTWRFKCDDGRFCTEDKCSFDGSTCRNSPINCYLEVNMTDYPCFRAECVEGNESYRCVRKLKSGVYIDICGNCLRDYTPGSSESEESELEADEDCIEAPEDPMLKEGLAAASIALIVLGAVIIGGAMAASGIIGTKTLLERARAANNQSAHSNPLFEDNETEMANPTYTDEKEV